MSDSFCDPMDCSPPGSSVHGILQASNWGGLPLPPPGDILPDPGVEPTPQTPLCAILLYKVGLMVTQKTQAL